MIERHDNEHEMAVIERHDNEHEMAVIERHDNEQGLSVIERHDNEQGLAVIERHDNEHEMAVIARNAANAALNCSVVAVQRQPREFFQLWAARITKDHRTRQEKEVSGHAFKKYWKTVPVPIAPLDDNNGLTPS